MTFSTPSNIGEPAPAGSPVATHSTTPPRVSLRARAAVTASTMRSPAAPVYGRHAPAVGDGRHLPGEQVERGGGVVERREGLVGDARELGHVGAHVHAPGGQPLEGEPARHAERPVRRPEKWPPPGTSSRRATWPRP